MYKGVIKDKSRKVGAVHKLRLRVIGAFIFIRLELLHGVTMRFARSRQYSEVLLLRAWPTNFRSWTFGDGR